MTRRAVSKPKRQPKVILTEWVLQHHAVAGAMYGRVESRLVSVAPAIHATVQRDRRGERPGGGKTDYCWLVFERGYVGQPEMHQLSRDKTGERCAALRRHFTNEQPLSEQDRAPAYPRAKDGRTYPNPRRQ
jgi:hypothetical protein